MGVLFLDGRETVRKDGAMTLRFATWSRYAAPGGDALVDARVCDSCQTAMARTLERAGDQIVMAWRDGREPAGIRTATVKVGE